MKKVFIDGSAGTTGLRIRERLAARDDLEVVVLPDDVRKDVEARRTALNAADVAFLCLPDAAAIEAVSLVENPDTVVIDTSTAHRTAEGWAYGFPELNGYRARIQSAKRIANPGCHATGFIALIEPLMRAGLLAPDVALAAFSLTGYTTLNPLSRRTAVCTGAEAQASAGDREGVWADDRAGVLADRGAALFRHGDDGAGVRERSEGNR